MREDRETESLDTKVPDEGKRDLIMGAAINVFSKKGYHQARMDDIAEKAGVAKGTLYLYFTGKEELLREIVWTSVRLYVDGLDEIAHEDGSVRSRLNKVIEYSHDLVRENRAMARVVMEGIPGLAEDARVWFGKIRKSIVDTVAELIDKGVSSGEIIPNNSRLTGTAFLGALWALLNTGWTHYVESALSAGEEAPSPDLPGKPVLESEREPDKDFLEIYELAPYLLDLFYDGVGKR
jgi:AcrR family transcriptional regulator